MIICFSNHFSQSLMSWNNGSRVSNPFGAATSSSSFGSFGQATASPFGAFGNQGSGFGSFGNQMQGSTFGSVGTQKSPFATQSRLSSQSTHQPQRSGKGKGKASDSQPIISMQEDGPSSTRVSNPFAAIGAVPVQALSLDEAVVQFKNEYRKRQGYPFSCFGLPEEPPILTGDICPAELRWYLSEGNPDVQNAISVRSNMLNEDFTDFLRGATGDVPLAIKRAGPYRIPDPEFPAFVPRNPFLLNDATPAEQLSESDLHIFQTRALPEGAFLPSLPPPVDLR